MQLVMMEMIARNIPLHTWREYLGNGRENMRNAPSFSQRKADNIARAILAQLTHPNTVELVAREWEHLGGIIRMRFTDLANQEYGNPSSRNKAKKIRDLDTRLGGKVLTRQEERTERKLRVIGGELVSTRRRVNPAVAGAERAHAAFALPKGYDSWPPAKKRRWRKKMAARRRKEK